MTMQDFLKENRAELDKAIRRALDNPDFQLNDHERRLWVLNDEGLYLWAKREGVKI